MRLVRVGRVVWDVLAITDDSGGNVIADLKAIDPSYEHTESMSTLLQRFVPRNGPPKHNNLRCSPLRDDIFEFKAGPKKGKKLRVLWFYDAGNKIICTHAFLKDTQRTPPEQIERSIRMRSAYQLAKAKGKLILPKE